MRLVLICGQPASGKSTVAQQLAAAFQQQYGLPVELIEDPDTLHLTRDAAYAGPAAFQSALWVGGAAAPGGASAPQHGGWRGARGTTSRLPLLH